MKKFLGLIALVCVCTLPGPAFAGDQVGVYVAPKFVFGIGDMQGFRGYHNGYSEKMGSSTDDTYGGSLAIGYDFNKQFAVPIRAEIEYAAFSKFDISKSGLDRDEEDGDWYSKDKQTFSVQTLFLNAYWDIDTGTMFTPYLGAGAGLGFINTKWKGSGYEPDDRATTYLHKSSASKTVTNFVWNVGAGLGVDLTDEWTLDVGYRFVGLGDVKTKSKSFVDYEGDHSTVHTKVKSLYMHQISAGVRYTF